MDNRGRLSAVPIGKSDGNSMLLILDDAALSCDEAPLLAGIELAIEALLAREEDLSPPPPDPPHPPRARAEIISNTRINIAIRLSLILVGTGVFWPGITSISR